MLFLFMTIILEFAFDIALALFIKSYLFITLRLLIEHRDTQFCTF